MYIGGYRFVGIFGVLIDLTVNKNAKYTNNSCSTNGCYSLCPELRIDYCAWWRYDQRGLWRWRDAIRLVSTVLARICGIQSYGMIVLFTNLLNGTYATCRSSSHPVYYLFGSWIRPTATTMSREEVKNLKKEKDDAAREHAGAASGRGTKHSILQWRIIRHELSSIDIGQLIQRIWVASMLPIHPANPSAEYSRRHRARDPSSSLGYFSHSFCRCSLIKWVNWWNDLRWVSALPPTSHNHSCSTSKQHI